MEVLAPPSMINLSSPDSPYASGPPKHRSILDRRASRPNTSPNITTRMTMNAFDAPSLALVSDPTFTVSSVTATGTTVRAPRSTTTAALLPFVPLTPIMASPRLTPDIGPGSELALSASRDGEHGASCGEPSPSIAVSEPANNEHIPNVHLEYNVPNAPSTSVSAPALPPSWTSTPPTPPLKGESPERSTSPSGSSSPSRVRQRPRSHQSNVRPASVAVFPVYKPPSPPPLHLLEAASPSSASSPAPQFQTSPCTCSVPFEELPLADVKRSRTLPRSFGKLSTSMPDEPSTSCSRSTEHLRVPRTDMDGVLPPSLSRNSDLSRGRSGDRSPLTTSVVTREDSLAGGRRPVFTLDDGEASEGEGDEEETEIPRSEVDRGSAAEDNLKDAELYRERERDWRKRYHALMELLITEVGYLADLRALVRIYLTHLPSLKTSSSSPLHRSSGSSISISSLSKSRPLTSSRSALLFPAPIGSSPPRSECPSSYLSAYTDMSSEREEREKARGDKDKQGKRSILSDDDLRTIRRNADQLLLLHQRFVQVLREKLEPLGFGSAFAEVPPGKEPDINLSMGPKEVDDAVDAVADAFAEQAVSFEIYESFCPGHNEAASVIRAVQERYPVEWDAYEQRCSLRVAHEFEMALQNSSPSPRPDISSSTQSPSLTAESESMKRKRRHSMSSIGLTATLSPFGMIQPPPFHLDVMSPGKYDSVSGQKPKGQASAANLGQAGRLKFLDYIIKPVQRLCKYPLLLHQLQARRKQGDADQDLGAIETVCSVMRAVVSRVDKASERQNHRLNSAIIASRLVPGVLASPTSVEGQGEKSTQLTADFMVSLGVCLLAGALDVVYPHAGGGFRVKYLAAFLYIGGYLVLAKVPKGGKGYEPKHWFSLAGFELIDEEEDDAALPYAFHLCCPGYHLHVAAACQLEKTIWMAAIQDALSVQPPAWVNEPVANIPADDRTPLSATEEFMPDWATPLPTIQSMSELETTPDPSVPAPPMPSPRKMPRTISKVDGVALRQEFQLSALNRRASTSSVKAFFAPLSFESRITRPSSQIRQQVDQGLHDVFSETFVSVRSQAQMRDEELFQLRRKAVNVSRSNSGLSISGAFGTRRRNDNTVFLSRRKNSVDGILDVISDPEMSQKSAPFTLSKRSKSTVTKRRGKLALSVVPSQSTYVDGDTPMVQSPEGSVEAPSPLTQCSSTSSSNVGSALPSPLDTTIPLPIPSPMSSMVNTIRPAEMRRLDYRPKRTRSMVDNVKHFFHSRSMSPTPSQENSPKVAVISLDVEADTPGGLVQWLRRGSLRRRVQSSPEVPMEDSSPPTPAASSEDSHVSPNSLSSSEPSNESSMSNLDPTSTQPARSAARRVAFSDATPIRRRSLFSSYSRLDFGASPSTESALVRSRTLKNIFSFQRSNSFTRNTSPES